MKKDNVGQVALIVLVVSAVVMVLGIGVARKSITETKIDTDEELLKQAFNAAESGVDYYLGTGNVGYTSPGGKTGASVVVNQIGGGNSVDFNEFTLPNMSLFFWFVGHDASNNIDYASVYSGSNVDICVENGFTGSLKIDYYYRNAASIFQVRRLGYNLGAAGAVTGFDDNARLSIANDSCGAGRKRLSLTGIVAGGTTPLLLAVTPISAGARITISGSGAFPNQGVDIASVGRAGDVSGTAVTRKIKVLNRYKVPQFMLEAVVANGSVLSN